MRLKPFVGLALAVLFTCVPYLAVAQTAPAAMERHLPLAAGGGISAYNPDWAHGHLLGETLWVDYYPTRMPWFLHGLGVEAEARDLSLGRSSSQPSNLREDVAGGGLIYSWRHFRNFRPYGKLLGAYGNTEYKVTLGPYHETRTVTIMGGGVEYRVYRGIWARGDYEYQFWPDFFKGTTPAGKLNPQGITAGVSYHFGHIRPH